MTGHKPQLTTNNCYALKHRRHLQQEGRTGASVTQQKCQCLLQKYGIFRVCRFQYFRTDRQNRHEGSMLMLVQNYISAFKVKTCLEEQEYQVLRIKSTPNGPEKEYFLSKLLWYLTVNNFSNYSQSWEYAWADGRGDEVEDWHHDDGLILINDSPQPPPPSHQPSSEGDGTLPPPPSAQRISTG